MTEQGDDDRERRHDDRAGDTMTEQGDDDRNDDRSRGHDDRAGGR